MVGMSHNDIADRLGVTKLTVINDSKAIWREQRDFDRATTRRKLTKRVAQLEHKLYESYMAWERSKRNEETITTDYIDRECQTCNGTGFDGTGKQWCVDCDGLGKKTQEVLHRKVRGQAGDAAHMNAMLKALDQICKMEGHYVDKVHIKQDVRKRIMHIQGNIDLDRVPADVLADLRLAMLKASEASNGQASIIDARSEEA